MGTTANCVPFLGLGKQVLKPGFRGVLEPNHIGVFLIYWLGYNIQGMRLGIHVRREWKYFVYIILLYIPGIERLWAPILRKTRLRLN